MEVKQVKTSIPGYRPSPEERETIIRFNEANPYASVYTFNPALIRKLDKLVEDRASEMTCIDAENINGVQARGYAVPKKWVKVNASRILSEEERARLSERGKANAHNLRKSVSLLEE